MSGPHVTTTFRRTAEKRNKMVRSPIVPTEKSARLTQFRLIAPLDEKLTAYLAKKLAFATPTVSPILAPATSRNLLSLQSLPHSIPHQQDKVRRRKDAHRVGTAARGSLERLSRLPQRLPSDGRSSGRVRRALSTRAGDRGRPTPRAPLPPGPAVPFAWE